MFLLIYSTLVQIPLFLFLLFSIHFCPLLLSICFLSKSPLHHFLYLPFCTPISFLSTTPLFHHSINFSPSFLLYLIPSLFPLLSPSHSLIYPSAPPSLSSLQPLYSIIPSISLPHSSSISSHLSVSSSLSLTLSYLPFCTPISFLSTTPLFHHSIKFSPSFLLYLTPSSLCFLFSLPCTLVYTLLPPPPISFLSTTPFIPLFHPFLSLIPPLSHPISLFPLLSPSHSLIYPSAPPHLFPLYNPFIPLFHQFLSLIPPHLSPSLCFLFSLPCTLVSTLLPPPPPPPPRVSFLSTIPLFHYSINFSLSFLLISAHLSVSSSPSLALSYLPFCPPPPRHPLFSLQPLYSIIPSISLTHSSSISLHLSLFPLLPPCTLSYLSIYLSIYL